MIALLFMWIGIDLPLTFLGFYFGYRKQVPSSHTRLFSPSSLTPTPCVPIKSLVKCPTSRGISRRCRAPCWPVCSPSGPCSSSSSSSSRPSGRTSSTTCSVFCSSSGAVFLYLVILPFQYHPPHQYRPDRHRRHLLHVSLVPFSLPVPNIPGCVPRTTVGGGSRSS